MSTATAPTPAVSPAAVADLSRTLDIARDATRLRVVLNLAEGPLNVTELCTLLGGASQPNLSHHLSLLRLSGIAETGRRGKFVYYTITAKGRALHKALLAILASEPAHATAARGARR